MNSVSRDEDGTSALLDVARDSLDAGDCAAVEAACRKALAAVPDDAEILHLLARTLEAQGRLAEAVGAMGKAVRAAPGDAAVHYELGRLSVAWEAAEIAAGEVFEPFALAFPWGAFPFPVRDHYPPRRLPDAIAALRAALGIEPDNGPARALLGLLLIGDEATLMEGVPLVQAAVHETPELYEGHLGMALLGLRQGNWQLVQTAAAGGLARCPEGMRAGALKVFAEAAMAAGGDSGAALRRLDPAALTFLADALARGIAAGTLAAEPGSPVAAGIRIVAEALSEAAKGALLYQQAFVRAACYLDHAARLAPDLPAASAVAGFLLFECSAFEQAEGALAFAAEHRAADDQATRVLLMARMILGKLTDGELAEGALGLDDLLNVAEVFSAQLDFAGAEPWLRRAAEEHPDDVAATLKLAQNAGLRGDLAAATAIVEDLNGRLPGRPEVEGDLANLYLAAGRTADAWPLYESRLRRERGSTPRPAPPVPRWDGQDLDGKSLLIWREEGIGDEIRFSSCLPDAVARFGAAITYECAPRLTTLYQRSFPTITVRAEDADNARAADFDYHLPAGSLPMVFRRTPDDFPADGQFLTADPNRLAAWRERFAALPPGPKIGIGWRSLNAGWHKLPLHSRLADWRPLFALKDVQFVNLQCGLREGEAEAAEDDFGIAIHRFANLDIDNDMEEVAAIMTAMDAIISCQCWLLHLGGAVGAKVYSFNGRPNPYTMGREVNPWAPQSEIFYRPHGSDWTEPMTRIAERVSERFGLRA